MEAVHKIHTHLDLNLNELRNVRLDHHESNPEPASGRIIYNPISHEIRYSDGKKWYSISLGCWSFDDDGNIVAEGDVIIRGNLIVEGDTTSGAPGQDTPSSEGGNIVLDDFMSDSSTNGVQNMVIKTYVDSQSKTLKDDLGLLDKRVQNNSGTLAGIVTDLTNFETWKNLLSSVLEVRNGDLYCLTNLIIEGDTSSGSGGQDTPLEDGVNITLLETYLKGYLPLTGGTLSGGLNAASFVAESGYITAKQGWFQNSSANQGLYNVEGNARWYYNLADDAWKSDKPIYINNNSVIHSGNIANQSVLSASKLTSKHYLWGNSFDGTQDISGNILLPKGRYLIGGAGEEGIYITDNTISWHGTNNLWRKSFLAFSGLDAEHTLTVFSNLSVLKQISAQPNGGMWITGKEVANSAFQCGVQMVTNAFAPVLAVKTVGGHTITYGGIDNRVGFYGYYTDRTQNGTDWHHYFNVGTGELFHSGKVTFQQSLTVTQSIFAPTLTSTEGLNITANNEGASARLYLTTGTFRPWAADAGNIDLGKADIQWRTLYAKTTLLGDTTYIQGGTTNPYIRMTLNNQNWYCQAFTSNGVDGIFLGSTSSKSLKVNADGQVYCPKDLIVSGDTASGSDVRFKDIQEDADIKVEDIANAPYFAFKWNDRDDNDTHVGTSAQYWEKILPELVNGEDFKTLNYASLGVAMGISLAKNAMNHEERIKQLEEQIEILKEENRRLKHGIC